MDELRHAMEAIVDFRERLNWVQFHTPKNLAAALTIEAGELQELLLWKSDAEAKDYLTTENGKQAVAEEIADVLIYALLFCEEVGIEPLAAIRRMLKINADKYPVEKARGRADKYTDLGKE
jgi:NTP pyrophosphatase (non-canonical NTP hydrolase)